MASLGNTPEFQLTMAEVAADVAKFDPSTVQINPRDLNSEFVALPGLIAYWNQKLAVMSEIVSLRKLDFEAEEARVLLKVRAVDRHTKKGKNQPRGITVDEVKAKTILDEDVHDANVALVKATALYTKVKVIVDSLGAKASLLQSLGAKLRTEMGGDFALKQQMQNESLADFKDASHYAQEVSEAQTGPKVLDTVPMSPNPFDVVLKP